LLARDTDDDLSGYLRVFAPNPSDAVARKGRVATSSRHRGTGLGHWLMEEALGFVGRQYGDVTVELSAQAYLERFYSRFGFGRSSENYLEDGIPHCRMQRMVSRA
jgi:ElaA protein